MVLDTDTNSIRSALFSNVAADGTAREELIRAVADEVGVGRVVVTDTLAELERHGEVYVVDGEVRRT